MERRAVDNCGRRKDEQWTAVADGKTSSGKLWQMIIRAVDSCDLNANHSRDRVLPFFALGAARPPRRSGGRDHFACALSLSATKIVQGWPKLWANFKALIGNFRQSVGPSLAIWANPVQFSFTHPHPSAPGIHACSLCLPVAAVGLSIVTFLSRVR